MYFLVPDRVAKVRIAQCDGATVTRPVRDNFVTVDRLPGWAGHGRITLLDRAGAPVGTAAADFTDDRRCVRRSQ